MPGALPLKNGSGSSLVNFRDLSGIVRLVRNYGSIGRNGRELVKEFASELKALAQRKRRRGYRDL